MHFGVGVENAEFVDNGIKTAKYNVATFLPIFLFEMFSRAAYLYFLLQVWEFQANSAVQICLVDWALTRAQPKLCCAGLQQLLKWPALAGLSVLVEHRVALWRLWLHSCHCLRIASGSGQGAVGGR